MDVERMRRLAEFVRARPLKWDMKIVLQLRGANIEASLVEPGCGAAGCLAGHALVLMASDDLPTRVRENEISRMDIAGEWLGLSEEETQLLFMPAVMTGVPSPYHHSSAQEAARVVDLSIETGHVGWYEPDGRPRWSGR